MSRKFTEIMFDLKNSKTNYSIYIPSSVLYISSDIKELIDRLKSNKRISKNLFEPEYQNWDNLNYDLLKIGNPIGKIISKSMDQYDPDSKNDVEIRLQEFRIIQKLTIEHLINSKKKFISNLN